MFHRNHRTELILVLFLVLGALIVGLVLWLYGWPLVNGRAPYAVVPDWPPLPEDIVLGQVTAVDIDSQGRVYVFARGEKVWESAEIEPTIIASPTVYVFNAQSGELLDSWGANRFVTPHGLTIDSADYVWLTDVGLHQIFKFDRDGNLLLALGEAGVPGQDAAHFNRPTDVAVRPDGSFYVSDGYVNSRVVRFGADGRFLSEWGVPGGAVGEFDVPHSVDIDEKGLVYVADRGNARLQIFDEDGRFRSSWQNRLLIGRPWAVRVGDDGFVYVVDGGDQNQWLPDRAHPQTVAGGGNCRPLWRLRLPTRAFHLAQCCCRWI